MRKSKAETEETRRRILESAATEVRRQGIAGAGVADVMSAVGLTNGGFYRHFESKDALVAEACTLAAEGLRERIALAVRERGSGTKLKAATGFYLSDRHRERSTTGCVLAALGSELARSDDVTRQAATDAFVRLVEVFAALSSTKDAERRAIGAVSAMIGALTMARVVTDPVLSATILEEAKQQVARLL